jgi:hypothetical protein
VEAEHLRNSGGTGMGIADSFRLLAEKAKARMAGAEGSTSTDEDINVMGDKYDNSAGDRFGPQGERAQEVLNERTDDFGGDQRDARNLRNNRDMPGA